jgi:hypothetical protein
LACGPQYATFTSVLEVAPGAFLENVYTPGLCNENVSFLVYLFILLITKVSVTEILQCVWPTCGSGTACTALNKIVS